MQKKTLLSACIALALSGQGWAADVADTDSASAERKGSRVVCPTDRQKLSPQELKKLPAECVTHTENNLYPWLAMGATALIITFAAIELTDDNGHHSHSSQQPVPPVPPVPPDDHVIPPDDGGDDVTPPDDGGDDVTPPDDGGDDVTPPDDGGDDVTPPDDGGDDVTPPDDGGDDVIPPDDGGDDVTPPDDGGDDVTPPDDGGDDVIPPDDGGDDDVDPPKPDPIKFDNDVTWDKTEKTLQIRGATFTYTQNADGSYTLTAKDGRTTIANSWQVHTDSNTVVFDGINTAGGIEWSYDDNGKIRITKLAGVVVDGTTGNDIHVHDAVITDQGGNTALNGGTVMTVEGNDITLNNDGKTTAIGEGSVVGILTGDDIIINNNGETNVDGGTAVIINGDRTVLSNAGDSTITNGGTGSFITGGDVRVNNQGSMAVDGKNSTGSKIVGNDATVKQTGDLYVSGGAHGIDVTGSGTIVNNKGNITVVEDNSIGVLLDGDGTTFINMGDITAGNAGAENASGVQISGDNATFVNVGDIFASNAGTGIQTTGDGANISLAGGMDVGDFSTGLDVAGNNNTLTLATYELNVTGQKATGVNVAGDGNTIEIAGNILVDKDQTTDNAADYFYDPSVGVNVSGNNNDITLDGQLTMVVDSETTSHIYGEYDGTQENITGLVVTGDSNTVTLNGGVQFKGETNTLINGDDIASTRQGVGHTPLIQVDGHSSVYLNGDSVISGDFPVGYTSVIQLSNGAALEIGDDAVFSTQGVGVFDHYFDGAPAIINVSSGSTAINKGTVDTANVRFIQANGENSTAVNGGSIALHQYDYSTPTNSTPEPGSMALLGRQGASVTNNGVITAKVMEQHSVLNLSSSMGVTGPDIPNNQTDSMVAIQAYIDSYALNSESGIVDMYGRGSIGMSAIDNSTTENAGKISIDALWLDVNDTTQLRSDIPGNTARNYAMGMSVGTDSYSGTRINATAINKESGVITLYNAGAGMAAYGSSNTVINQGTINLEKNENYDDSLGANKLVGMAVYNGGTAINDQTGVININAEIGQAFYNDGSGTIVNYGTICTFGVCQSGNEYNDTDNFTSLIYTGGDTFTESGEAATLNRTAVVTNKQAGNVVNSGTLSGEQITILSGVLENTSDGVINNFVALDNGAVINNNGVMKNNVDVNGGTLNNAGEMTAQITMYAGADSSLVNNTGTVSKVVQKSGVFNNSGIVTERITLAGGVFNNQTDGTVKKGAALTGTAVVNNDGTWNLGSNSEGNNAGMLEVNNDAIFNNSGEFTLDNSKNAVHINQSGTLYNTGHMAMSNSSHNGAVNM